MFSLDFSNNSILISGVEIGTHFYWDIGGVALHGQVFLVSWFVITLLVIFSVERKLHAPLIPPRIQSGTPRAAYYAAVFLLSFLPSKTFRFNDDKRLLQETLDRR